MCRKLNNTRLHENKGFTLTEVVIASSLLIVALVPILRAVTIANSSAAAIAQRTESLNLAQAKLDRIKATSVYNYSQSFSEKYTPLGNSYLCNVTDTSVKSPLELREISVYVGYDLNSDKKLSTDEIRIQLSTYLARRM